MREKRIKLFNDLVDLAAERGEIEQFEKKYTNFNGWESANFKNSQSVIDLYNKTIALGIFSNASKIEDFFKKFACDFAWAKTLAYCGSTPTPTPAPTAAPGATPAPTSSPGTTTAPTLVDTNLTGDDLTAGKVVKHGMKGDIVGKIQDLLIAKGFTNVSKSKTADKIFGNRTQRMVKAFQALNGLNDDGIVGKLTWGKLNDASAVTAGSTPDSTTNKATSVNSPEEVPGSDAIIVQESRKKILRKYLLQFK